MPSKPPTPSRTPTAGPPPHPDDPLKDFLLDALEAKPGSRLWHGGATPEGAVRGVSAEDAAAELAPGRPSIWRLALHVAYWRYAVRRHLTGETATGGFARSPSNWPAPDEAGGEAAWRADRALLAGERQALVGALRAFPAARLRDRPPGSRRWSYLDEVHGALLHDIHHAAQLVLLKKQLVLVKGQLRRPGR